MRIRDCRGSAEYPRLVEIWCSAVDATHDFLLQQDRQDIEARLVTDYLPHVHVFVAERGDRILGFAGVADASLEMLFVDAAERRSGIGSALMEHALLEHGVRSVDVNEQNVQAIAFYIRRGFSVVGRSPQDSEGRPYPLLHMAWARETLSAPEIHTPL